MIRYADLARNRRRFLALTGYRVDEFRALLSFFIVRFHAYVLTYTLTGEPRHHRRYSGYKNSSLSTMEDTLLFMLIYLKTMHLQETQGQLFGMQQSQASQWMHLLLPIVNHALADCGELPARRVEDLDVNEDKTTLFFHDGTERAINRPKDPQEQKLYYSGKQKQHTIKNDILINEDCKILFLTDTVEGKRHEKKLADEAGYRVPEGSVLIQDTGFQGFTLTGVVILQAKKKPKGGELSYVDKVINRVMCSIRIRIEHAISGVKRYRMVKDTLRNWKTGFRDLVFETCCGLHNFRLNFRPWHYETPAYLDYLVKS